MRMFKTRLSLPSVGLFPPKVYLVLAQFNGMLDGYNANRGNLPEMSLQDLLLLNLAVDMGDIERHVEPSKVGRADAYPSGLRLSSHVKVYEMHERSLPLSLTRYPDVPPPAPRC